VPPGHTARGGLQFRTLVGDHGGDVAGRDHERDLEKTDIPLCHRPIRAVLSGSPFLAAQSRPSAWWRSWPEFRPQRKARHSVSLLGLSPRLRH
jgi:hypothetical protein